MASENRACRALLACMLAGATIGARADTDFPAASSVIDQFDIPDDGDGLLLPTRVNGRDRSFVLDTGCTTVLFDESLRTELGPSTGSISARGLDGAKDVSLHEQPRDTVIGKLRLRSRLPVGCVDFSHFREASGYDIHGVIGMAALWDRTVRIDFDRQKVFFLTTADGSPGERVELLLGSGVPKVAAKSTLGTQMWTVDTGCVGLEGGSISTVEFSILLRKRPGALLNGSFHTGLSGAVRERSALLGTISFGRAHFDDLVVSEHPYSPHNALGLAFWSRFNITFDFPNRVMYLQKNRNFPQRDQIDLSGARFVRRDGQTVVDNVDEGSPAAGAGLEAGDVLSSVRRMDAARLRIFWLRRLCATPHETIEMGVIRGNSRLEIVLTLPGPLMVRPKR